MSGASLSATFDKLSGYPQLKMALRLGYTTQREFQYHRALTFPFSISTRLSRLPVPIRERHIRNTGEHSDHMYITTWQRHVLNKAVEERTYGIGIVLEDQTS